MTKDTTPAQRGPFISAEGLYMIAARTVDHRACPAEAHDTSLPDGWQPGYEQAALPGGKAIACNDCKKALFYCVRDENWHHVDPDAECFLCGPWSAPFGWLVDHATGVTVRAAAIPDWVMGARSRMTGGTVGYPGAFRDGSSARLVYVEGGPDLPTVPQ
jgi:hypothetical protein